MELVFIEVEAQLYAIGKSIELAKKRIGIDSEVLEQVKERLKYVLEILSEPSEPHSSAGVELVREQSQKPVSVTSPHTGSNPAAGSEKPATNDLTNSRKDSSKSFLNVRARGSSKIRTDKESCASPDVSKTDIAQDKGIDGSSIKTINTPFGVVPDQIHRASLFLADFPEARKSFLEGAAKAHQLRTRGQR